MKKLSLIASLFLFGVVCQVSASVLDYDLNPADFRGNSNTTFQAWDFLVSKQDPSFPEAGWVNPNGEPFVDLVGDFSTNTVWLAEDYGHKGIWIVDRMNASNMFIEIRNFPDKNLYKEIWLQLVYSSQNDAPPVLSVSADDGAYLPIENLMTQKLDSMYTYGLYKIILIPNPQFEKIQIRPQDCQIYIDGIIVDTQCIPEPMTMVLLGLGGLFLRKRIG